VKIHGPTLTGRLIKVRIDDWPRIISVRRRVSGPHFKVLYAAEDFPTAFAEAVVRDRFEGKERRFLYRPHLDLRCVTAISSSRELQLADLRGGGAYELGIDTDAKGARAHDSGQSFSAELHDDFPDVDGILFDSRLTGAACVAVYGRALPALSGSQPVGILQSAALVPELERLKITVRRKRGGP
jgi:hypothetical protein